MMKRNKVLAAAGTLGLGLLIATLAPVSASATLAETPTASYSATCEGGWEIELVNYPTDTVLYLEVDGVQMHTGTFGGAYSNSGTFGDGTHSMTVVVDTVSGDYEIDKSSETGDCTPPPPVTVNPFVPTFVEECGVASDGYFIAEGIFLNGVPGSNSLFNAADVDYLVDDDRDVNGEGLVTIVIDPHDGVVINPGAGYTVNGDGTVTLSHTFTNESCEEPPPCVKTAAFTHTYDPAVNGGTITATGEFCGETLYVTPTEWVFTANSQWPQDLVDYNIVEISGPGTYPYGNPVGCGQGDIYAQWGSAIIPTERLSNPSVEFAERFLHEVSDGPKTWVVQNAECYTPPPPTCEEGEVLVDNECVPETEEPIVVKPAIQYVVICGVDNNTVTTPGTPVENAEGITETEEFYYVTDPDGTDTPGTITVLGIPKDGFAVAEPGDGDTYVIDEDGNALWTFVDDDAVCPTELPKDLPDTLALTGSNSADPLAWGVGLVGAGSALFLLYLFGPYLKRFFQARRATSA